MHQDKHTSSMGGYLIRSLYFDDVYDSALNEKESGIFHRSKYRIRVYNASDSFIRFEKKEKFSEYISKRSVRIGRIHYDRIMAGDYSFMLNAGSRLLRDVYVANKTRLLKPVVIVDYDREAYVANEGNVRITFDKELRAGINTTDIFSPDLITLNAYPPGLMVMEVKYDDFLPANIRQIIQTASHHHMAISKYVLCRQALAKNNWREPSK